MELTYTKVGDYYIPDLILDNQPDKPLGRYGWMHQLQLKNHLGQKIVCQQFVHLNRGSQR